MNENVHKRAKLKRFKCDECGYSTCYDKYLQAHMHIHTGNDVYKCNFLNPKPYECNICNARFKRRYHMIEHTNIHLNIKNFTCGQCGAAFVQHGNLKSHMRSHIAAQMHVCEYCGVSFRRFNQLTVHKRSHANPVIHNFDQYEYDTNQNEQFECHKLSHADEKQTFADNDTTASFNAWMEIFAE